MGDENSIKFGTKPDNDSIKLNVGGKLFETTSATLESSGPDSLLSALSNRTTHDSNYPVFIDRDPEIFSVILSLIRTNRLPSTAHCFSNQELAEEAGYYGIETLFKLAMSPPCLSGVDASLVTTACPAADAIPSAFTVATEDGSLLVAHDGRISSYDWSLSHAGSIRTHLDDITSINRVWSEIAAIGSESAAGLHFYNLADGCHFGSVHWTDPTDPRIYKARVTAISNSPSEVFASFDSPHKENCVLGIDKSTLQVVSQLGRQMGISAKTMVPTKLKWILESGVLMGSGVTFGAFGYSGYIRLWDPRSGQVVWETNEPGSGRSSRLGDSFADVDVDGTSLFKICSRSGDLALADLRNLSEDPWVYLSDKNPSMKHRSGVLSSVIHCYQNQVFVGREGELEVWSKLEQGVNETDSPEGMIYRRNYVDKAEDSEKGIIKKIEGGGNRLFASREYVEGIEVWESSNFSGLISVL